VRLKPITLLPAVAAPWCFAAPYCRCCHAPGPVSAAPPNHTCFSSTQVGVSLEPLAELGAKEGSKLGAKEDFAKRVGLVSDGGGRCCPAGRVGGCTCGRAQRVGQQYTWTGRAGRADGQEGQVQGG